MKTRFLAALLLPLLAWPAAAQPSPTLDPSFPVASIYQPTTARGALQLNSGARVVAGYFDQAAGQPYGSGSSKLVRYQPAGAPETVFNATLAADDFEVSTLAEAANGKLLVGLAGPATFGGQQAPALVQLDADGRRDAAFATYPASATNNDFVARLLVQPDGKIVVGGTLTFLNQPALRGLARLQANGTIDNSFQPQLTNGRITEVSGLARQPDGKLLVAAYVELPGTPTTGAYQLVRLLANGVQDPTFQPALNAGVVLSDVAVQPDGQVLVSSGGGQPLLPGSSAQLARLSPSGVADASFAPASPLFVPRFSLLPMLVAQPDGRILVGHSPAGNLAAGHSPVARLLPSGAFDPAWSIPQVPADALLPNPNSIQLLPTGQVLVAGTLLRLGDATDLERGAALLSATGQPSNSFRPALLQNSAVRDIAQQPDGRLVAVGNFTEVNGQAVRGIVRFQLSGEVDTAFCRRARLTGGSVARVLAQPDGSLLLGGNFTQAGGPGPVAVARLLPSGQPDAAFTAALANSVVTELVRQPDGKLLLAGTLRQPGSSTAAPCLRLNPDGTLDASFQPPATVAPTVLLVQPNGSIVVGSSTAGQQVLRLLPNGAADPTFTVPVVGPPASGPATVNALALQPDGGILLAGSFSSVGALPAGHVARLLPSGQPDASFAPAVPVLQPSGRASALALQPNGRILLAGTPVSAAPTTAPSLYRLLPDGSFDTSFDPAHGPNRGRQLLGVSRLLVQSNGAIVAAGSFTMVGSLPVLGLTRLLAANVLATRPPAASSAVQAWPVPTHGLLHVSLPAALHPQRVAVLNVAGQQVRAYPADTTQLVLDLTTLPPGAYVVRVDYWDAPTAFRRIMVE